MRSHKKRLRSRVGRATAPAPPNDGHRTIVSTLRLRIRQVGITSEEQHGVTIAVEPIPSLHRLGIRAEHTLPPTERAHEHEQR